MITCIISEKSKLDFKPFWSVNFGHLWEDLDSYQKQNLQKLIRRWMGKRSEKQNDHDLTLKD